MSLLTSAATRFRGRNPAGRQIQHAGRARSPFECELRNVALLLLMLLGWALPGLAKNEESAPGRSVFHQAALTDLQRASIYDRSKLHFENALLIKPAMHSTTNQIALRFAPLIIQEAVSTNTEAQAERDLFGIVAGVNTGSNTVVMPQVFFRSGKVTLNRKPHAQITYCWFYPTENSTNRNALMQQGVRVTLDSAGRPVIWEVLADTSSARLIFVSQEVEAAAMKEFGRPLSRRRLVVERSVEETPNVVVGRVVDDGPEPMGPIMYLRAGTRDTSTIICRCMDSQAKAVVEMRYYQLTPAVGRNADLIKATAFGTNDLGHWLRLPHDF